MRGVEVHASLVAVEQHKLGAGLGERRHDGAARYPARFR
jgi:hypothetical protein